MSKENKELIIDEDGCIDIEELRKVQILFPLDFYTLAVLIIRIKNIGQPENITSSPTIHGLIQNYESLGFNTVSKFEIEAKLSNYNLPFETNIKFNKKDILNIEP